MMAASKEVDRIYTAALERVMFAGLEYNLE